MDLQPRTFAILHAPQAASSRGKSRSPTDRSLPNIKSDKNRLIFQRSTDDCAKIFTFQDCLRSIQQAKYLAKLRRNRLTIICGGCNAPREELLNCLLEAFKERLQEYSPAYKITTIETDRLLTTRFIAAKELSRLKLNSKQAMYIELANANETEGLLVMPAWNLLIKSDPDNSLKQLLTDLTAFLINRDSHSFCSRLSSTNWQQIDILMAFNPSYFIEGKNLACYQRKLLNESIRAGRQRSRSSRIQIRNQLEFEHSAEDLILLIQKYIRRQPQKYQYQTLRQRVKKLIRSSRHFEERVKGLSVVMKELMALRGENKLQDHMLHPIHPDKSSEEFNRGKQARQKSVKQERTRSHQRDRSRGIDNNSANKVNPQKEGSQTDKQTRRLQKNYQHHFQNILLDKKHTTPYLDSTFKRQESEDPRLKDSKKAPSKPKTKSQQHYGHSLYQKQDRSSQSQSSHAVRKPSAHNAIRFKQLEQTLARERVQKQKLKQELKDKEIQLKEMTQKLSEAARSPEIMHLRKQLQRKQSQHQAASQQAKTEINKLRLQVSRLQEMALQKDRQQDGGQETIEALEDQIKLLKGMLDKQPQGKVDQKKVDMKAELRKQQVKVDELRFEMKVYQQQMQQLKYEIHGKEEKLVQEIRRNSDLQIRVSQLEMELAQGKELHTQLKGEHQKCLAQRMSFERERHHYKSSKDELILDRQRMQQELEKAVKFATEQQEKERIKERALQEMNVQIVKLKEVRDAYKEKYLECRYKGRGDSPKGGSKEQRLRVLGEIQDLIKDHKN